MIRLEQVRGEILERFERVDRRFAQNEQRTGRMDQRLGDIAEQIEALRREIRAQLELLAGIPTDTLFVVDADDGEGPATGAPPPATPT